MKKNRFYYQLYSCFFFSILGLQIKLLAENLTIETIIFYRSIIGTILIFIFIFLTEKSNFSFQAFKFHFFRSIFGVLAMFFGYKALTILTLAQASTLGFTKVFFTSLLATIMLKEKILIKNFFLIFLGFIGVFLIAQPSKTHEFIGIFYSITSSICVSFGIIIVSFLTKNNKTVNILFYHSLISSILIFFLFYENITFKISSYLIPVIFLTLTAIIGQYFNTESYKNNKANIIVIASYSRIIFSTFLGFIFLNEDLMLLTLLGILVVIISTFFVQNDSKKN